MIHAFVDGDRTEVPALVGLEQPDLVLLNDEDLAYAKIRLDERSWNTAVANLANIEDPLARTLVWGAAWDATRDGEESPREYIKLVLNNILTETESTTIQTTLGQLLTTARFYVADAHREQAMVEAADGLLRLARAAKAGSDVQYQLIKFYPQLARTSAQLDALQALFDGSDSLSGLEIDADLRWELLIGLVVGGRAGEAEIAAEFERDSTANGQKSAAAARAAIATKDAKAAAWHQMVETKDLSNALVNAASMAFVRVNDLSLLEEYADKYFDNAVAIWKRHTFKIAEYMMKNLYPTLLVSEELAKKTRAAIADPAIKEIPALRRIIVEHLAAVERALLVQARDLKG